MPSKDIISIQLYSLRDLHSLDAILDCAVEAGYTHVEMIGSHLADPKTVRAELDSRGLKGSSSHVGMNQLRLEPEKIVEACQFLGISELYMPAVPPEQRDMPAEGWRELGKELGHMAGEFEKAGIRLGYHNHDWELAQCAGNATALDCLFDAAGSSPLTWQADIAWLARGGADPRVWLEKYASRVASAHVKDIAPQGQNLDQDGWADVGSGVLDWTGLWQAARAAGAHWMITEHDKPKDPAAFASNSLHYLLSMKA